MVDPSIDDFVAASMARACNLDRGEVQAHTIVMALGIDSLSLVAVINSVCLAFGVEVDEATLERLLMAETVGDFTAVVEGLISHAV